MRTRLGEGLGPATPHPQPRGAREICRATRAPSLDPRDENANLDNILDYITDPIAGSNAKGEKVVWVVLGASWPSKAPRRVDTIARPSAATEVHCHTRRRFLPWIRQRPRL